MLILFGLVLSEQIHFRKIDEWKKIVEVVRRQDERGVKAAS